MRRLGLIILANILLFSLPVMGAAFYGNIPQTTLQIARDTTVNIQILRIQKSFALE